VKIAKPLIEAAYRLVSLSFETKIKIYPIGVKG
jgi:hypothetical protein